MIGAHLIKSWATTQASIALSSAEAELVAMTKATAETIGIIHMVKDLAVEITGVVYADSSAALAIADRRGSGKLRHICIRKLWLQEKEQRGEVELRKVKGQHNPADLLTKYMNGGRMEELMKRIGQVKEGGRARTALDVQGGGQRGKGASQVAQEEMMDESPGLGVGGTCALGPKLLSLADVGEPCASMAGISSRTSIARREPAWRLRRGGAQSAGGGGVQTHAHP